MELKNLIYQYLCENNLFGLNTKDVIKELAGNFSISTKQAFDELETLKKDAVIDATNIKLTNRGSVVEGSYTTVGAQSYVRLANGNLIPVLKPLSEVEPNKKVSVSLINISGNETGVIIGSDYTKGLISGRVVRNNDDTLEFHPNLSTKIKKYILADNQARIAEGRNCVVRINFINSSGEIATCSIDKVFGRIGDPIARNEAIAAEFGFEKNFSPVVENELNNIPNTVSENEIAGRLDLRNKKFITIDPETCKDMDDACYIEKYKDGYRLYVAIADVSHYVKQGSEIDKEAYKRGTSCYLGSAVYPMLPEKLSNNICSLEQGKDRLVLCCSIDLDLNGKVRNYDINKAVINSVHKLSYEQAEDIHLNRNNMGVRFENIKKQIDFMYETSDILSKIRDQRGALRITAKEPTFVFDKSKQRVVDIVDKSHVTSHEIIESFMILANECVANYFQKNNIPVLYRNHEQPDPVKFRASLNVLKMLGIECSGSTSPSNIQKIIDSVKGTKYESFVTNLILKSFKKAKYQPTNIGHYGLGSDEYLHFTSPIRRYPDLIVHRQLSALLEKQKSNLYKSSDLSVMGSHLTEQEKKSEKAERISNNLLNAMWATEKIDIPMDSKISYFAENGVFVELGNNVTVRIPFTEMGKKGRFKIKARGTQLLAEDGTNYTIGDPLRVKIESVDLEKKHVTGTANLSKVIVKDNSVKNR